MINFINGIGTGSSTNFLAGFQTAFKLLEDSVKQEFVSGCNRAMLFLTDGRMDTSVKASDLHDFISE
jgi:hypothetical protein